MTRINKPKRPDATPTAAAEEHACGHHGPGGCMGCATGHPCPACLARIKLKKADGNREGEQSPKAGFTLIELLIVIGLLGALTALVLPRLQVTKSWAVDESMAPAEMMDIRRAYAAFQADCLPTMSDQTHFARSGLRF